MRARPATRPGRMSTSSTATAASPPIPSLTFRPTGRTPSASKGKGANIVASQPSLQPLLPALEIHAPLRVRHDGYRDQPQGVADDPPSRGQVARLVVEQLGQLDRRRVRIGLGVPALLQHCAGLLAPP